jgi:hypothetical protein
MILLKTKSPINKSLIASACVAASMVFAINGATAATLQNAHNSYRAPAHVVSHVARPTTRPMPVHTASRWTAPQSSYGFFGRSPSGSWLPPQYAQIVQNALRYQSPASTYSSAPESPTYSYAEPVDNGATAAAGAQAAADSVAVAASMEAAQVQNDAANAATSAGINGS